MVRTAFNVLALVDSLPLKIESMTVWKQHLFVGTTEGQLLLYRSPDTPTDDGRKNVHLERHESGWSRKPILQLEAISCGGKEFLLAICDEQLCVYTLPNLETRSQCLAKTKGATAFAVRQIDVAQLAGAPGGASSSSSSSAVTSTRPGLMLAVAVKKKVFLYRLVSEDPALFQERGELPPLADTIRTLAFCGSERVMCVGLRSKYVWININLKAPGASDVQQKFDVGKAVVPTILVIEQMQQVLLGRDAVHIFLDYETKPARSFGLTWTDAPLAVGYAFPYVIGILAKCVEVRAVFETQRGVAFVQTIPLKQMKILSVRDQHVYVASNHCLFRLVPIGLLDQVQQLLGQHLFEEALALCEQIPVEEFPGDTFSARDLAREKRIESIKVMHAYHLFAKGEFARALALFLDHHVSPLAVIGLYHGMLPAAVRSQFSYPIEPPADLSGTALTAAHQALIAYLAQVRQLFLKDYYEDDASIAHSLQDNYSAVTDPAVIIDTTLFKIVTNTKKTCAGFLQRPGDVVACHVRECEKAYGADRYELVPLYRAKRLHSKALELLIRRARSPDTMHASLEAVVAYLCDLGGEHWPLIVQTVDGVASVLAEQRLLGDRHQEFPPVKLLPIFSRPRPEGHELPADRVLELVRDKLPDLLVDYLENAVLKEKSTVPLLHDELVLAYLDKLLRLMGPGYPAARGATPPGSEPGLLGQTRKKLLEFLENSAYYFAPKMMARFPDDRLLEERAILLSKMEQHEAALSIYANRLHDYRSAEEYCERIYQANPDKARDVYLSLLNVYLEQAKDTVYTPGARNPALDLLRKHYTRFDTASALRKLDNDIPVADLWPFLQAVLRSNNKRRRNSAVIHSLVKSEKVQTHLRLIQARRARIVITEDKMCPVCTKRLGSKNSVFFTCYPDGTVCHVFCASPNPHISPITGRDFTKPLDQQSATTAPPRPAPISSSPPSSYSSPAMSSYSSPAPSSSPYSSASSSSYASPRSTFRQ